MYPQVMAVTLISLDAYFLYYARILLVLLLLALLFNKLFVYLHLKVFYKQDQAHEKIHLLVDLCIYLDAL